ncbi:MAG: SpoIIE family protein phosphatase [Candidatus Riflebacteria bacterium]|nr:SpoIIE family protein phosphatase [Candidatus Riflebacteria bacterium]
MTQKDIVEIEEYLDNVSNNIFQSMTTDQIFGPPLKKVAKTIIELTNDKTEKQIDKNEVIKSINEAKNTLKVKSIFLIFDKSGNPINIENLPTDLLYPMRYLWSQICKNAFTFDYPTRKADLIFLAGNYFNSDILKKHEEALTNISINNSPAILFHSKALNALNGLIVRAEENINYQQLLIKLLNEQKKISYVLKNSDNKFVAGNEKLNNLLPPELFTEDFKTHSYANHIWKIYNTKGHKVIIGHPTKDGYGDYTKMNILAFLLLAIMTVAVFFLLKKQITKSESTWISIKHKLIFVFLSSVYMPIITLYVFSFSAITSHRTILENNTIKNLTDILYKLDSDYSNKEKEILEKFRRIYQSKDHWKNKLNLAHHETRKEINNAAYPITNKNINHDGWLNWIDIRDIKQNRIYNMASKEIRDRVNTFARILSLLCLQKVMPEQLQKAKSDIKRADMMLANFFESPIMGVSRLIEQPDNLIYHEFNSDGVYWYWNYYNDPSSNIAYISLNTIGRKNIVDYLESAFIKRHNIENVGIKFFAYHKKDKIKIPQEAPDNESINNLIDQTEISRNIETKIIKSNGVNYIAVCFPGVKLINTYVTAMYPISYIDNKITQLENNVLFGILIVLVFSVLTGLLLSQNFIYPLKELDNGLKALQKRETDYSVKVDNRDELGLLAITFNKMVYEIKEMLLAAAIQKCLIPSKTMQTEKYDFALYNQMAGDVGGDYADFFNIEKDELLIVIGDVTGHGVSSSLLVAMVKASIFKFCSVILPHKIFSKIGEMIFELLKRKKLMTMLAIKLNLKNNSYLFTNAGHPYPIICDKNGNITELEADAMPLGVSAKRNVYSDRELTFESNDVMMLYSDGICEAEDETGKPYGKNRLFELLQNNKEKNSNDIKEAIIKDFNAFIGKSELSDDITFIIIKHT